MVRQLERQTQVGLEVKTRQLELEAQVGSRHEIQPLDEKPSSRYYGVTTSSIGEVMYQPIFKPKPG